MRPSSACSGSTIATISSNAPSPRYSSAPSVFRMPSRMTPNGRLKAGGGGGDPAGGKVIAAAYWSGRPVSGHRG